MAGPEQKNPLYVIGEVLKKISAAAGSENEAQEMSKVVRQIKKEAKDWSDKVLDKDAKVRALAKKDGDKGVYKSDDIAGSREKINKAQGQVTDETGAITTPADPSKTPEGLESDPAKIQTPQVAEYTASLISIANGDAQLRDPNIVLGEVAKLYRSVDLRSGATREVKAEVRKAIDAGISYAKKLAIDQGQANPSGVLSVVILPDADYQLNRAITPDESFDLYRSRILPEKKTVEYQTNTNKGNRKYPTEEGRKAENYNKQLEETDLLLKSTQDRLDVANARGDLKREQNELSETLKQLRNKTQRAVDDELRSTLRTYEDLVNDRLAEISPIIRASESVGGQGGRGRFTNMERTPPLSELQQSAMKSRMTVSQKAIAQEVFDLGTYEHVTVEQLKDLQMRLVKEFNRTAQDSFISKDLTEAVQGDQRMNLLVERGKMFNSDYDTLMNLVSERVREFGDGTGRGYFGKGTGKEDLIYLQEVFKVKEEWKTMSVQDLMKDPDFDRAFRIANKLLDRGTTNNRGSFREGFDLFDNEDWKLLIQSVQEKLSANGWTANEIRQFRSRFTALREMRELVHDLRFAENFSNLENLNKMVATSMSGDLDVWIAFSPGMRQAFSVLQENIRHLAGDNNGRLLPELMEYNAVTGSLWESMNMEHFEDIVRSGQFTELSDLHRLLTSSKVEEVQQASEIMLRTMDVARAFSIITLRAPMMIAEGKIALNFTSGPFNNLVQDVDPFRHLIIKYGIGKPGLRALIRELSGDAKLTARLTDGMADRDVLDLFWEAEHHPQYGARFVEFRNFFKHADRFGDGKSFWGLVTAMKDLPQELKDVRGVGLKLFDAYPRVERMVKAEAIKKKYGKDSSDPGYNQWISGKRAEVEKWWMEHVHSHEIHHEIGHHLKHEITKAMEEFQYKAPGELVELAMQHPGYEWVRYEAQQKALEATHPELLKKILRNEDGSTLKITSGGRQIEIKTLHDLVLSDPRVEPPSWYEGIRQVDKDNLQNRLNLYHKVSRQMSGDLGLVQQVTFDKIWKGATGEAGGIAFNVKKDMLKPQIEPALSYARTKTLNADSMGEVVVQRDKLVDAYIDSIQETIKKTSTNEQGGERRSFYDHMHEKFMDGTHHNIATTADVPMHLLNFSGWGGTVLSRTTGDQLAVSTGTKNFGFKFLAKFNGHPDRKELFRALAEDVKSVIAAADDNLALNIAGFGVDVYLNTYTETKLTSDLGLLGKIITSEPVIEGAESISKFLGFEGRIPSWMWGSPAQQVIDPGANRDSSAEVWTITREAAELGLLPREHHPYGWAGTSYKYGFTKQDLRNRYHGNTSNALWHALMLASPIAVGLAFYQAVKEASEEGDGGGHH